MKAKPAIPTKKPRTQKHSHCSPAHFVFILLTTATATLADNSVRLQVAVKGEHGDPKDSVQEVHQRWLEVSATAFHLEKPQKVRIEWSLFGDDLTGEESHQAGGGC